MGERAVDELFRSGIEEKSSPSAQPRPSSPSRTLRQTRPLLRPARPRPAGRQILPRPLVSLLRHRARSLARSLPRPSRGRRPLRRHLPADRAPERLHVRPARPALPRPHRPRLRCRRAVRPRLHRPRLPPRYYRSPSSSTSPSSTATRRLAPTLSPPTYVLALPSRK
jgi:hypothetical protein